MGRKSAIDAKKAAMQARMSDSYGSDGIQNSA